MNETLQRVYYNPADPGGFSTVKKLRNRAQVVSKHSASPSHSTTRQWTSGQDTYTLHKKVVRKFQRRKYISRGIGWQYQADLIQLDMLARYNSNYKYILVCIDIFSRKAFAEPVKRKTGKQVGDALEQIFIKSNVVPKLLQVDHGAEFYNRHLQSILGKYGVKMFSVNSIKKAALVERLILSLKRRLFKWMSRNKTKRYLDVLPDIVHAYNHSVHRSINMRPVDVTLENERRLWYEQYADQFPLNAVFKFKVGHKVRIAKDKQLFEKSYVPQWSQDYYVIARRRATKPVTYQIKNLAEKYYHAVFMNRKFN